jgi:ribosome-binding protein aMBF1 (putative translation factor)
MAKRHEKVSDKLRAAILAAPVSRYRMSADTGINASVLSRFVNGITGLDSNTTDKLAEYLGLELREKDQPKDR